MNPRLLGLTALLALCRIQAGFGATIREPEPLLLNTFGGIQLTQDEGRFSKTFPFFAVQSQLNLIRQSEVSWRRLLSSVSLVGRIQLTSLQTCADLGVDADCGALKTNSFLKAAKNLDFTGGLAVTPARTRQEGTLNALFSLIFLAGYNALDAGTQNLKAATLGGLLIRPASGRFRDAYYILGLGSTETFPEGAQRRRFKTMGYLPFLGNASVKRDEPASFGLGILWDLDIGVGGKPDAARLMLVTQWNVLKSISALASKAERAGREGPE